MNRSEKLFQKAQDLIPGGVNSPVRAFKAVGGTPKFIEKAKGPFIWDVDGNRYLDFVMSWGPLILGHSDPKVIKAISDQAKQGTSFGAPTQQEIELAELIHSAFPSIQKVRLVSSGTEAVMSAIRLARGVTGKKKILKCDGCYHGHADSLLIKAGSGGATFGIPNSAGVPEELAQLTLSVPYNDIEALEKTLSKFASEIACFILEPVPANMGVILPKPNYLKKVRELTKKYGVLLIFDEVITGFRLAFGGAQEFYGLEADLTCLGKIVGGGLPIGAFGGRSKWMDELAPQGKVYQAGTLSGNPIATSAGIATLKQLKNKKIYTQLQNKMNDLCEPLESEIKRRGLSVTLNRIGSMFTIFFTSSPLPSPSGRGRGEGIYDFASAHRSDTKKYARYFHALLSKGVYMAPSQFETNFISAAHPLTHLKNALNHILEIVNML